MFQKISEIIIRIVGAIVLALGLIATWKVFNEALTLYENPARIEWLAEEIEKISNLDKNLVPSSSPAATPEQPVDYQANQLDEEEETLAPAAQTVKPINSDLRLTYFFAWIIELSLLLLVGRIGITALRAGSDLLLYDIQYRNLRKELAKKL
ncbi:MAG: hypothetical protein ACYYK0_07075 [Candidatus Eutrophobiaceae bacterium]